METSYAKPETIVQRSRHMSDRASTVVSRVLDAPREAVYRAYLDRDSLAAWLPPGAMTGVVHAFDAREGGAFSMSLVYPEGGSRKHRHVPRPLCDFDPQRAVRVGGRIRIRGLGFRR